MYTAHNLSTVVSEKTRERMSKLRFHGVNPAGEFYGEGQPVNYREHGIYSYWSMHPQSNVVTIADGLGLMCFSSAGYPVGSWSNPERKGPFDQLREFQNGEFVETEGLKALFATQKIWNEPYVNNRILPQVVEENAIYGTTNCTETRKEKAWQWSLESGVALLHTQFDFGNKVHFKAPDGRLWGSCRISQPTELGQMLFGYCLAYWNKTRPEEEQFYQTIIDQIEGCKAVFPHTLQLEGERLLVSFQTLNARKGLAILDLKTTRWVKIMYLAEIEVINIFRATSEGVFFKGSTSNYFLPFDEKRPMSLSDQLKLLTSY